MGEEERSGKESDRDSDRTGDREASEGKRIGVMAAFFESLAYVQAAAADKSISIRGTDKQSALILRISVVAALIFVVLPFFGLMKYMLYLVGAADFCFLFALCLFIIGRFGIIRVMSPRHALVCWQLMVGTSMLAMALAINVVFFILLFFAGQFVVSAH
jgi:hypothetical protein